jgi:hypothetical protein
MSAWDPTPAGYPGIDEVTDVNAAHWNHFIARIVVLGQQDVAHFADTTAVHGIADTSLLATKAYADGAAEDATASLAASVTTSLAGKSNTGHTHATSDVSGLDAALAGRATDAELQALADIVTALTTTVAGKQSASQMGSFLLGADGRVYTTLAQRLDAMDVSIAAGPPGPPPETPGIYLGDPDILKAAEVLDAGTGVQVDVLANTSGSQGGGAPGEAGLPATGTNALIFPGNPSPTVGSRTGWFASTNLTGLQSRASQKGTWRANDLPADLVTLAGSGGTPWPATADADAVATPVTTLRIPSEDGTNVGGAGWIRDSINAGAFGINSNHDGTSLLPAGDIEILQQSRAAFACAYQAAVFRRLGYNEEWAQALFTQAARLMTAWSILQSIDYDNVRGSGSAGASAVLSVMPNGGQATGSRIYANTKLVVAWSTENFCRAASLVHTYGSAEWAAVSATGEQDFKNMTQAVLLPHISGGGGVGNSTTRGWTSGGNWGISLADGWIAIAILNSLTGSGSHLARATTYLDECIRQNVFLPTDRGLTGLGDTTTVAPYPGATTVNNTSAVPGGGLTGWDTLAKIKDRWSSDFGSSASLFSFKAGAPFELVRDISHTLFTLGNASAACRSLLLQGDNAFQRNKPRLLAAFEFVGEIIYTFLTTPGAVESTYYPPTTGAAPWPISDGTGFQFAGQGWMSGWEIAHDYYVNVAGESTAPGGAAYWLHRVLSSTATVTAATNSSAGVVNGATVKSHFRPSRPSASILLESMTHGDISL